MSEPVRNAVFGNVGTIICFRISPDDAPFLTKYFEPQFEPLDLIQQHSRFFVATMMIGDEKAPAFSAKTLNLPLPPDDLTDRIIAMSRERYTQERAVVEKLVRQNAGLAMDAQPAEQLPQAPKPHVQAQINRIHEIEARQTNNEQAGRVGSNILQAFGSPQPVINNDDAPTRKRRRGKRGGKKNRAQQESAQPAVIQPTNQQSPDTKLEQTIRLR